MSKKQEMYHYVRDTLNKNFKGKAVVQGGCTYLNGEGQRCVIGCFLSEDDARFLAYDCYNPFIHKINFAEYPEIDFAGLPKVDMGILKMWQKFHDNHLKSKFSVQEQRDALFNKFVILTKDLELE